MAIFPLILPLFSIEKTQIDQFLKIAELKCFEKSFEYSPSFI